ncbi:MAG TPA: AMP-binding protein [Flavobacteriales bacterium]|nr:AMP-binding protein [Flavobacteriales bacterium]HQW39540.1 AMP-binding protein [Flavobacteriales bacterium]
MPKRYSRSIEKAFERLTLDGVDLSKYAAFDHFSKLKDERKQGEDWKEAIHSTLFNIVFGNGSMAAFTSGTTGPPKKLTIPKRDLVNSARLTAETFDLNEGDRVLLCLPCNFIAGKMMFVRAMALGLDLHVIDPRGSVLDNLKVTDRFKFAPMVPLQLYRAIQENKARVEEQFEMVLLGGGPVSEALMEDLQDLSTNVFQSYGSTETVTHVALRKLNGRDRNDSYSAIGKVHFGRDPRGCLVVFTPHLSVKQHITNDLIELHDETHFTWLGRYDNVILSGGKKIFPEQLEAKTAGLLPFPHYFKAFPDPELGQAVMLVLATDRPQDEVMPEVLETLMANLDPHEWPRRVQALERIEMTSGGKVIRGA